MRKWLTVVILLLAMAALPGCGAERSDPSSSPRPDAAGSGITAEMAYEGVYNYCHGAYDWSVAEDNPDLMYLEMGEASESEYLVIFRSDTGAFVYFYVDKADGTTRMIEYVPALAIKNEAGTIDLYDYLGKHG